MGVSPGGSGRGRYYLHDGGMYKRAHEENQEDGDERIDERVKGKYEVWKFGLGPSQRGDAVRRCPFWSPRGTIGHVCARYKAFPHGD